MLVGAAGVALAGCGPREPPARPPVSRRPAPRPAPVPGVPERSPGESASRFDFRTGRWLSLHLALYELGVKATGPDAWSAPGIEAVDGSSLPPNDAAVWSSAVDAYRLTLGKRDPVFDREVAALHRALAEQGSRPDLGTVAMPGDLRRHLETAMPIYEARWWQQHVSAAATWHLAVHDALARHEDDIAVDLARYLHHAWPAEATWVDLAAYANWAGAYSTLGPLRIYVSTLDARNQGTAGIEVLFHEASHGLIRTVRDAIGESAKKQGKQPRDLWHVVLFVTSGEVVRRRFPGHVPYGEKHGLYEKGPWRGFRAAVESGWRPYLHGRSTYEAAIDAMVAALPA